MQLKNVSLLSKQKISYKSYLNPVIKSLQKEKSRIVTIIKKHNRFQNVIATTELHYLKNRLKLVRQLLQDNFRISMNKQFDHALSKINSSNQSNMFLEVKKMIKNNNLILIC